MLIERDRVIAGFPAVALREFMRELMHCSMSVGALHDRIESINLDATDALARLDAAGLIRVAEVLSMTKRRWGGNGS